MTDDQFIWKIENLSETDKQNIKTKIIEKVLNTDQFNNLLPTAVISKNPQGGADIIISIDNFIVEGHYQDRRIVGTSILWVDNPQLGILQYE
jgi:hypothetical protein